MLIAWSFNILQLYSLTKLTNSTTGVFEGSLELLEFELDNLNCKVTVCDIEID